MTARVVPHGARSGGEDFGEEEVDRWKVCEKRTESDRTKFRL